MAGHWHDGDMGRLDAAAGTLTTDADLAGREPAISGPTESEFGMGRELFTTFRNMVDSAEIRAAVIL